MFSRLLCAVIATFSPHFVKSDEDFTWCTEDANVASWGMDLGTTVLYGVDSLEFYASGDWGAIGMCL